MGKRTKMKLGEIEIDCPHFFGKMKKPIWGYFDDYYTTGDKPLCTLMIVFKEHEEELMKMMISQLWGKKLKSGIETTCNPVRLTLPSNKRIAKASGQTHYARIYYKLFFNIDLSEISIEEGIKEIGKLILKSVTKFSIKINKEKIEPFKDKALVEMI